MSSGSKRQKLKNLIRKPFFSDKGKAVSNNSPLDRATSTLAAASSDVAVNESSPSGSARGIQASVPSTQAPEIHASSGGGIFNNASHFSMNKPVFLDNSTTTTVNIHATSDKRSKAYHSRRGSRLIRSRPPPRCHPGTRIEINEHIITWFYDEAKKELLLWVYGPAGVGKSAIMQTLADKLAECKHLGASAFLSRPNGRDNSGQLFTTIAYQLAVHIEDYCTFVAEKLDLDPDLVNKGVEDQFRTFIVEPFIEQKVAAGGHPWCIILDGLDELDENRSQRAIIHLIADFVLEHHDAPLLWVVASRPEPHILDTFDEEKVASAFWRKHVPANSIQSCRDVEHFLRASLERIQKLFPRTVPKKWPSEEQFSSLAAAASGLFVFADTSVRFIEDPRYANPTMRLNHVLSALNGLSVAASHDQPFASLDALYSSILSSIPSDLWLNTKRVLGTLLYAQAVGRGYALKRLGSISVLLRLDLGTVYASVNGCYSLLNTADPKDADWKPVTFYHASFGDFLLDPTRSKTFYISVQDVEDELLQSSLVIWKDIWTNHLPVPGLTYGKRLFQYFSDLISSGDHAHALQYELRWYLHEALFTFLVEKHDMKKKVPFSSEKDRDQCFEILHLLEDGTLCMGFEIINKLLEFFIWLFDIWEVYQEELISKNIVQDVGLKQFRFSQLGTCPARMMIARGKSLFKNRSYQTYEFGKILSIITQLETRFPQLPVLACGSPGKACLIFRYQASASDLEYYDLDPSILQAGDPTWVHFAIPFSHSTFYHDAEHFLRANFETISSNHPQIMSKTWPSKEQFLKLAGAVSHQPVFATIAMEFVENSHYGDPVTSLDQLLALIDGVDHSHPDDQPFIYVDALYSHILSSISSDMWPRTYQILSTFLYGIMRPENSVFKSPRGISAVLSIEMPPENIPLGSMAFKHASFFQYLTDSTRSQDFYISLDDTKSHIFRMLIKIWLDFKKFTHGISENMYLDTWNKYCSQYHCDADPTNDSLIDDFNQILLYDTHNAPFLSIWKYRPAQLVTKRSQDYVFHILSELDFTTIFLGIIWYYRSEFVIWLLRIWNRYEEEMKNRGLFHEIRFRDLRFDHLEWYRICRHVVHCNVGQEVLKIQGKNPNSPEELEGYISGLQLFQQHEPQLPVLIGGSPGKRYALFAYDYTADDVKEQLHNPESRQLKAGDVGYYILPYPDDV